MQKIFIPLIVIFFCCCSPPFQVKPRQDVTFSEITHKTSNDLVQLQAEILSEDQIVEIFDGNLLLAGSIPIKITIVNKSQQSLAFTEKDFSLSNGSKQRFSKLKPSDALESLFKYYKIKAYSPYSYEKIKVAFSTHSLSLEEAFTPNESRSGMIYFKIKPSSPLPKGLQLKLVKEKMLKEGLTISLN